MRAEIAAIPDGVYEFTEHMENDGVVDEPVHVPRHRHGRGRRADRRLHRAPIPRCAARSTRPTASRRARPTTPCSTSPTTTSRRTRAPTGRSGSSRRPARPSTSSTRAPSVGGNTETHPKLTDMVMAALAPALPERVAAAEGGTGCNFLFGGVHPKTGDYYANYHLEGGGWGGKSLRRRQRRVIVKNGNCRNTPVEIFETRYPLRVVEYSLIEGSGGAGRMRGGLGTQRILARPGGRRGDLQRALRPHQGGLRRLRARRRRQGRPRRDPRPAQGRDRVPHRSRRCSAPSRRRSSRTSS